MKKSSIDPATLMAAVMAAPDWAELEAERIRIHHYRDEYDRQYREVQDKITAIWDREESRLAEARRRSEAQTNIDVSEGWVR